MNDKPGQKTDSVESPVGIDKLNEVITDLTDAGAKIEERDMPNIRELVKELVQVYPNEAVGDSNTPPSAT